MKFETWLHRLGIELPHHYEWFDDYADRYQVMLVELDEILYKLAVSDKVSEKVKMQALSLMFQRGRDLQNRDAIEIKPDKPFSVNFNVKRINPPKQLTTASEDSEIDL